MNKFLKTCIFVLLPVLLAGCRAPATAGGAERPATDGASFSVTLLSTGKSDCAVIEMDGLVILNDAADEDDYDAIAAMLRADGVTKIDYLILSHYDRDHIGSAPLLIRDFAVGRVVRPAQIKESREYYSLVDAELAKGVPVTVLTEDYRIETANGQITVEPPGRDYGDENNNSAITVVCYRDHRLLFLGDAKKKRLEEFLSRTEGTVDFVKLPHHGDYSRALKSLIKRLRPQWAAATVSSPDEIAPELAEYLSKRGVILYSTADGPVRITWNGEALAAAQTAGSEGGP